MTDKKVINEQIRLLSEKICEDSGGVFVAIDEEPGGHLHAHLLFQNR